MNKYDPLENYLLSQDSDYIKVSFEQIADLVDGLPETAYSRPEWWANEKNESTRHVQAKAWIVNGWKAKADLRVKFVEFTRVAQQLSKQTFLLTWNPDLFDWEGYNEGPDEDGEYLPMQGNWGVGNRKTGISIGDSFFHLRQKKDRGLIAHGHFTSEIWQDEHWQDDRKTANYADVEWDYIAPIDNRYKIEDLAQDSEEFEFDWNAVQAGGIHIQPDLAAVITKNWEARRRESAQRTLDLSTLLKEALENLSFGLSGPNEDFQQREAVARKLLIENRIPALVRSAVNPLRKVKGSIGMGGIADVPWVSISDITGDMSAMTGYYLVYLFAADGSKIYLSLNQGTEDLGGGLIPLKKRATDLRTAAGNPTGFIELINLESTNLRPKRYAAGNAIAIEYPASDVPDDDELFDDLERMTEILETVESTSLKFNPNIEPLHVLLKWSQAHDNDTINAHQEIAEANESVWWGRFGHAPISESKLEALKNQCLMEEIDTFIILHGGGTVHRSRLLDITTNQEEINEKLKPQYYSADDCGLFLQLTDVEEMGADWLNENFVLASNPMRGSVMQALGGQSSMMYLYKLFSPAEGKTMPPQSRIEELVQKTGWNKSRLETVIGSLEDESPQIIFAGPPGTGKTFIAQAIAEYLVESKDDVHLVQFHPSYGYEEFVQGLRPTVTDGAINFEIQPGPVIEISQRIEKDERRRVLIIDEMNRANIPRVFGELMFLLEYRDKAIDLQYSKEFSLPKQFLIIGTMNTADRSIKTIDIALRRRFDIFEVLPDRVILERHYEEGNTNLIPGLFSGFDALNERLKEEFNDDDFLIGHSFFMKHKMDKSQLEKVWDFQVKPILKEYFYDQPDIDQSIFELTTYF